MLRGKQRRQATEEAELLDDTEEEDELFNDTEGQQLPTVAPTAAPTSTTHTSISNGIIKLGINSLGAIGRLQYRSPEKDEGESFEGIDVIPTAVNPTDATADTWGIWLRTGTGGAEVSRYYSSNDDLASTLLDVDEGSTSAISSVATNDGYLNITHGFHPSSNSDYLYEVTVTLPNTGSAQIPAVSYIRYMKYDDEAAATHSVRFFFKLSDEKMLLLIHLMILLVWILFPKLFFCFFPSWLTI